MSDPKTMLVMPGAKFSVHRMVKRAAQVAMGVALSGVTIGSVMVINGLLSGKASLMQLIHYWLAYVQRPEILVTMIITALMTLLVVAWQRDKEGRR
jgi:uncharacterized membrane protein YjfL (UPF0719 family)